MQPYSLKDGVWLPMWQGLKMVTHALSSLWRNAEEENSHSFSHLVSLDLTIDAVTRRCCRLLVLMVTFVFHLGVISSAQM